MEPPTLVRVQGDKGTSSSQFFTPIHEDAQQSIASVAGRTMDRVGTKPCTELVWSKHSIVPDASDVDHIAVSTVIRPTIGTSKLEPPSRQLAWGAGGVGQSPVDTYHTGSPSVTRSATPPRGADAK